MHFTVPVLYRCILLSLPFIVLAGLAFLWFSVPVFPVADAAAAFNTGITYYVSPTGSDLASGSEIQPFKTIQKAADVVSPGDTVLVEDGVYTGNKLCAGNVAVVCLSRGGTSTATVTFRSRNRHGAKIQGQVGLNNEGWYFLSSANYITIDGFDVFGVAANVATGGASGFALYNGGSFSRLLHNKIHDIGRICTDTTKGQNGIFAQQPNITIEGNEIYNIGRFAPGENGCTVSTANYQNHDHGIYIDGAVDSSTITGANSATVRNNIFYDNRRGWSIQLYPGSLTGLLIANNTFAFENPYRTGHILVGANLTDARIINNLFYDPTTAAINFYTGNMSGVVVNSNMSFGGVMMNVRPSGVLSTANLENIDPMLLAPLVFDFHPQLASPVVDTGMTLADVNEDFDGNPRPQGNGIDIGAYERTSLFPTPTPTPTPTPSPTPTATPTPTPIPTPTPLPSPSPSPVPTPNTPPIAVVTSPGNGSIFMARTNIAISGNASDTDGRITRVEFYKDGVLIGTDALGPYSVTWKNVPSGNYRLNAKAIDNLGATTTSVAVWITVKGRTRK